MSFWNRFINAPTDTSQSDGFAPNGIPSGAIGPFQPTGILAGNTSSGIGTTGSAVNTDAIGFGPNIGTGRLALGGLQGIGNFFNAFQAQNMANKSFNFQKDLANRNLANSIQSYNTRVEDTARARASAEGSMASDPGAYVERNRLPR